MIYKCLITMKQKNYTLKFLFLLALIIWYSHSFAQISIGGTPPSFKYETKSVPLINY